MSLRSCYPSFETLVQKTRKGQSVLHHADQEVFAKLASQDVTGVTAAFSSSFARNKSHLILTVIEIIET